MPSPSAQAPVRYSDAVRAWLPLATSWLCMGLELPLVSAVVARLPDPKIGLAAYGGVVFPLALLIESPVIMLLSASTALSRDERSYRVGRRVMMALGIGFTALHALVAYTPLYDLLARRIMGVPEDIIEPARLGLRIMTPWTLSIAYRRFQQGVLIRFGRPREVSIGTAIRLGTNATVLAIGAAMHTWPGIVVGTSAVTVGVMAEAVYAGIRVRSTRFGAVRAVAPSATPLTTRRFVQFYIPLMVTPLILFLAQPISSAAISRMPRALDSLATWPVVMGLIFTLRSSGFALNEVVVALLDRPHAWPAVRRLAMTIAAVTSTTLLLLAATPLSGLWFGHVSALPAPLVALGVGALWFGILVPALSAGQSLYQGALVHSHKTQGVSESMVAYLLVTVATLVVGIAWGQFPGLNVAVAATALGSIAQVAWLRVRARDAIRALRAADRGGAGTESAAVVA